MFRLVHAKALNNRRRHRSGVSSNDRVTFGGGLNLTASADRITPGELLSVRNYEPHFATGAKGPVPYERIRGFEVFDGHPRPHLAEYWKIELASIAGGPFQYGEQVTDGTETAIVVNYVVNDTADDTGYLIVTNLTNDVDEGASWAGGTSGATATGVTGTEFEGEVDEDLHDEAQLAAENYRRAFIKKVGDVACEGPVRGVNVYNNTHYAFRDLVGGANGSLWRATPSGWVQVALGFKVYFTDGQEKPDEGDIVVGVGSGASCVIQRVVLTAGFWAGSDGDGYIVTSAITGAFIGGEELQVGGETIAVTNLSTPQQAQTLPPGGRYRFRNYNFGGHTKTTRMYGVNGAGNAFEFDGTVFTLIETGMEEDQPTQIGVHRGHLLLGFSGGSLQHSGKNAALSFQPVLGANEILAGDEITGFIEEIGDVTFVFTRNKTFRLEGFVQENLQLKLHNSETGAFADSIQRIGRSVYLDDRGFSQLPTTDAFGDFASAQISIPIDPLVQSLLRTSSIEGSVINRGRSIYRCFFDSRGAIAIGFSGNRVNGITTIDYGLAITATANGEMLNEDGKSVERIFIGDQDGWVYETDVGRNFNGEDIEAYAITAYHFSGSPEHNKRYRRATLYFRGSGRTSLQIFADYNYNEEPTNFEEILNRAVPLGGGRYGIDRHNQFLYSRASQGDVRVPMNSHARNVSLIIYHKEKNEEPHILDAVQYHISARRLIRK